MGAHSVRTGMEFRQYRETDEFFANNQTGQFNFDCDLDARPARQLAGGAGLPRPVVRVVPARPAERRAFVARAASYDEKSHELGLLRAGRLARRRAADAEPRPALRVRDAARRARQPERRAASTRRRAADGGGGARAYALNPATGVPVSQFNVRGGLTFAGVNGQPDGLYETPKNNLMPRIGMTYKLNDKTVLRGGYGMFYGFLGQRRGDVIQSGFSRTPP